jgi:inner membrane protein
MIASLIQDLGPWSWVVLGLVLMGLELLAPGAFLLWLGLAAVLTGILDWLFGLSWQAALLAFAVLSIGAVLTGRAVTRHRDEEDEGRPVLNRRAQGLVGRVFVLADPIAGGCGRLRVDDSSWRIVGPDAPAGASVRVTRVDGATLVVELV